VEQVELRAVIATDSATSSSWTAKIDRVQLGPDKLVPSLFFRTQLIELASIGGFASGQMRVSRIGNKVTIDGTGGVSPSADTASTAVGTIPTWARPVATRNNLYNSSDTGTRRVQVTSDGTLTVGAINLDGTPRSIVSFAGFTISYTVPDTESPLISTTEALFKVIRARVRQFSQNVTTSNATMIPTLKDYDTVGSFNMTTGIFKVPRSGKLKVNAHFRGNVASTSATNTSVSVSLFKNATLVTRFIAYRYVVTSTNLNPSGSGRIEIDVQSGDEIDVRINRQSQISSFDLDGTDEGFIEFEMAPDLSVYGVQGQVEILSAESAIKSGITSAQWVDLSGNGLPLTPGIWRLPSSAVRFSQTSSVTYTRVAVEWQSGPGSAPATLGSSGSITVLSSNNGVLTDYRNISVGVWVINSTEYIIKVNSPVTVYLNAYAEATGTLANARVTSFPTAQRIA